MKLILISQNHHKYSSELISDLIKDQLVIDGDLHLYFPKEKNTHKIEEIKTFIGKLNIRPMDTDKYPTYVLPFSHNLTSICQNALLKTLEESSYSIILLTNRDDALLPTIKSRCQVETLKEPKDESEVIKWEFKVEDIPQVSREEREKVKSYLESAIINMNYDDYTQVEFYQEALNKLEANCKIESILYELASRIKLKI